MITIEDFKEIEIKIGTIIKAEKIENADKLLLLEIDLGEDEPREIVSGIAEFFSEPEALVGRQIPVVSNLEPKELRGHMSHGMILAAGGSFGLSLLHPDQEVPNGTRIK